MLSRRSMLATALAAPAILRFRRGFAQTNIKPRNTGRDNCVLVGLYDNALLTDPRIAQIVVKYGAVPGVELRFIKTFEFSLPGGAADAPKFIADMMATGLAKYAHTDPWQEVAAPLLPNDPKIGTNQGNQQWFITGVAGSCGLDVAWGVLNTVTPSTPYGASSVLLSAYDTGYGQSGYTTDAIVNHVQGLNSNYVNQGVTSTNTFDISVTANAPSCSPGLSGHGTTCANIMCGATNNGVDIAGVAGGCSFVPYVGVTNGGNCSNSLSDSDAFFASCMSAAITAGVNAIYINLVSPTPTTPTRLATYAATWGAGIFITAAAGDEGNTTNYNVYPCLTYITSPLLCLVASTYQGKTASYSDRGNFVALSSPAGGSTGGNGTMATVGADGAFTSANVGVSYCGPVVVGVAGLMMTANPHLKGNPSDIMSILLGTAQPTLGQEGGSTVTQVGWNKFAGVGMLNAGAAVQAAANGGFPSNRGAMIGVN